MLNSGIDDKHEAFVDQGRSRVRKTFDFTRIREIVSSDVTDVDPAELKELADAAGIEPAEASSHLKTIVEDCRGKAADQLGGG